MVKHRSIRIILSLVAHFDLELEQFDVETAFLNGELEEEMYMSQPKGFVTDDLKNKVCLLKRSLYELKQSPRQWYWKFDECIIRFGYSTSEND